MREHARALAPAELHAGAPPPRQPASCSPSCVPAPALPPPPRPALPAGFAALLAQALHPRHGTLMVNMHSEDKPRNALLSGLLGGGATPPPDLGYDPEGGRDGRRILATAATFAGALRQGSQRAELSSSSGGGGSGSGGGGSGSGSGPGAAAGGVRAFTVSVPQQLNVQLVVSRGLPLDPDRKAAAFELQTVAATVAAEVGYRFPAGRRTCRGYWELHV